MNRPARMKQQTLTYSSNSAQQVISILLVCTWLLGNLTRSHAQPSEDKTSTSIKVSATPKAESSTDSTAGEGVFAIEAIDEPEDTGVTSEAQQATPAADQTKEGRDLDRASSEGEGNQSTQEEKHNGATEKNQLSPNAHTDTIQNGTELKGEEGSAEEGVQATPTFVEGELVSVGQIGLLPWDNRFGAQIGIERLGEIYYGALNVGINHRFSVNGEPLRLTIGIPLRFELLDSRPNQRFDNIGRFRQQDWDEASDFAKVIQRLQYGSKEQRFFLDINRFSTHNLGHGLIMKRYDANLNLNTSRVGVQLDAFSDYIGFESMLNDITNPNLVGALVFLKPLSIIDRSSYVLRSFSLGISAVADLRAPARNALDRTDLDNDGRRETELQVDQKTFQPNSLVSQVTGYGIDAELKLVDEREFDLKTYFDMSSLRAGLPTGDPISIDKALVGSREVVSSGWAWGHLIRSNLGIDPIHALRIRLEYRNFDSNYLPSYFDSLYEIQRFQYTPSGGVEDLANATKLQRVFGRDPNGPRVHGGYFETSWRVGDGFAFAFGLEVNNQTPDNHGFVHLELPKLGKFQLSTTYHRRNAQNRKELFAANFGQNDIWILQTRFRTFSWLYNNLSVMTPFGFGPDSVFRSAIQVNLSLEIGFSYGDGDRPKKMMDRLGDGTINPAALPPAAPPLGSQSDSVKERAISNEPKFDQDTRHQAHPSKEESKAAEPPAAEPPAAEPATAIEPSATAEPEAEMKSAPETEPVIEEQDQKSLTDESKEEGKP